MAADVSRVVQEQLPAQQEMTNEIIHAFSQLQRCLDEISVFVQRHRVTTPLKRLFSRKDAVKDLEDRLKMALSLFRLQIQISLQRQLHEPKGGLGVRLNSLEKLESQLDETVQWAEGKASTNKIAPRMVPLRRPQLFGRNEELDQLAETISTAPAAARIAVLGAGGIGKSSLALAALTHGDVVSVFANRSYFIPCDTATSASGLVATIAAHLGLSGDHLLKRMVSALSRVKSVIVLDNFETPWEDSRTRSDVEDILAALGSIPTLTIVLTMRGTERPSGLQWSKPLMKPLQAVDRSASQQIFLDISPRWELNPELAELLDYMEDMPLAITLAARLAEYESLGALLERWKTESISLIRGASLDRLSCLDTSIRISVTSPRMAKEPEALRLLSLLSLLPAGLPESFVHPSLPALRRAAAVLKSCALASINETDRLRVLSPIRMFVLQHHALERDLLAPFEGEYTRLCRLSSRLGCTDTREVRQQLVAEAANVESLCSYILRRWPSVDWPIPVICRFDKFLHYSGLKSDALLQLATSVATKPEHVLPLYMQRILRTNITTERRKLAYEALAFSRQSKFGVYEAEALVQLGVANRGSPSSLEFLEQALAVLGCLSGDGYARQKAYCLYMLAGSAYYLDDYPTTSRYADEAIRCAEANDLMDIALDAQLLKAEIHSLEGRLHHAAHIMDLCVQRAQILDDTDGLATALTCKANIADAWGDLGEALRLHQAADTILMRRGDAVEAAYNKLHIVALLAKQGDTISARYVLDGVTLALRGATDWRDLEIHFATAILSRAEGDLDEAVAHATIGLHLARRQNNIETEAQLRELLADMALDGEDSAQEDIDVNLVLALLLTARIGSVQHVISAIPTLGMFMLRRDEVEAAIATFRWGIDWATVSGMKVPHAKCSIGLAEAGGNGGEKWHTALHMAQQAGEQRLVDKCMAHLAAEESS